jgi:hypothetical protein
MLSPIGDGSDHFTGRAPNLSEYRPTTVTLFSFRIFAKQQGSHLHDTTKAFWPTRRLNSSLIKHDGVCLDLCGQDQRALSSERVEGRCQRMQRPVDLRMAATRIKSNITFARPSSRDDGCDEQQPKCGSRPPKLYIPTNTGSASLGTFVVLVRAMGHQVQDVAEAY